MRAWVGFAIMAMALGVIVYREWEPAEVEQPDGILAAEPPSQELVEMEPFFYWDDRDYALIPRAKWQSTVRLISVERYRSEREADLSPVDFAVGWGGMSDNRVLKQLKLGHHRRFFSYSWERNPPLPKEEIQSSSTNIHLIPSSPEIEKAMHEMPAGSIVELEGLLVDVRSVDGEWAWKTSLSRDDSGWGACEILYLTGLQVRVSE